VLRQLGEVEAGAEVLALPAQHRHPDLRRQVGEGGVDLPDQRVADGVALGRAVQPHMRDRAVEGDAKQVELVEHGRCVSRSMAGGGPDR
jgi:hypothetical protein